MSTVDNKIIPNQLNVIINTSVPGYQKIEYKPYMTIHDISKDDKKIMFNPLFKLNKSYVDKVPENLRKKQFFNKGLFDSLLNFTNGTKTDSLLQATRNGLVDNNIKITLDAIFPENSVLYINKKPYTIADFQWSKGNWKIDTKIKKFQLDSSKITDPALYQTVIKDEIISGEKQLQSLPPGIIYGTNYTGPKDNTTKTPFASGVTHPSKSTKIVKPLDDEDEDEDEKPIKLLTNLDSDDESIVRIGKNFPNVIEPITKMLASPRTTQSLRVFLKEPRFFNLINTIYTTSSKITKIFIQKSLSESIILNVDDDIDELTKETYDKNVSEIKTIKNSGQGNCFFISVADAINYHNYYNQKNRIISGRYGTGINLYTQAYLRSLVVTYLNSWSELASYLLNIAPVNADELNDLFEQQINAIKLASGSPDDIAPDVYVRIANDIFNSRDNFLLKNVERVPIEVLDYYRPFNVIEKGQIENYILSSDFWANEVVIYALCSELKLNIIPLQSIKTPTRKSTLRVPYANFAPEINNWNKYLFLYYNQGHYELITFNQKTNVQKITNTGRISDKIILKKAKIIFDRNDNVSELPPIYILFTIFGSYFSSITNEEDKLNFTFKKEIMLTIQNIINNTLYIKSYYSPFFYPAFKIYFPNSNIRKPANLIEPSKFLAIEPSKGGAYPRYNPYYRPAYYNPQYMAHNMEKRDKDSDDSQLAYIITIDMELRPGTSLSPEELTNAKCNSKWNSIRKSWSELSGNPYVIPPVYNKEETNKTQNTRPDPQNNTRKYFKGGKHNKTVKLY